MDKQEIDLDRELDRTRAKTSRRLMKAFREGRLEEELDALDREGRAVWKEAMGNSNGRGRRRRAEARS